MILLADEPWSRPGDYVLLRASSDLVCSSSACPDDIDPANAWECTDVHVRVYPASNRFSMAVAHRVTAESEAVLTKETAFHPRTSELPRASSSTAATGCRTASTTRARSPSTGRAARRPS